MTVMIVPLSLIVGMLASIAYSLFRIANVLEKIRDIIAAAEKEI